MKCCRSTYPFGLSSLAIFLTLVLTPLNARANQNWRDYYEPINNIQALDFTHQSLEWLKSNFSNPLYAINNLSLRFSQPINKDLYLKKNFRLTEINNLSSGDFTIYISHKNPDEVLYGQLAHEVAHLLDPQIEDVYMEGLCTWLASQMFTNQKMNYTAWEEDFQLKKDDLYSLSYFMIKDLAEHIDHNALKNIIAFSEWNKTSEKKFININRWLNTLNPTDQITAKQIIAHYTPAIQNTLMTTSKSIAFETPTP